jgi:hypothetical protein
MRLPYIDDEELDSIAEAAVELFKVPSLGTERRSGIAAEDQRYGFAPAKGRELHLLSAAQAQQLEVGRVAANGRRQSLALGKELHQRGAPIGLHRGRKSHHPIEVLVGQMLSQEFHEGVQAHVHTSIAQDAALGASRKISIKASPGRLAVLS